MAYCKKAVWFSIRFRRLIPTALTQNLCDGLMCSTVPFSRLGSTAQLTCVTYVSYSVSAFSTPITCHSLEKTKTNKQSKQNKIKNIQALDRKTTKPNQKQISDSFFIVFLRSTVVKVSFCSLTKGLSWKIADCVFVLINSVLLNLLCVWMVLQHILVSQYHNLTFRFGCHEWCHQRGGRCMRPTLRPGPVTMAKRLEN